jgi:Winged helix-turn-helix DNA-binding
MNKVDWDYTENRKNSDYLRGYREEKEQEILGKIYFFALNGGISKSDLAKEVRLDVKTVWRYITRLKAKRLVKKSEGLRGKYLPTESIDPLSKADLLGDSFRRKVLFSDKFLVSTEDRVEFPFRQCIDFTIYKRYFEPRFGETDLLEKILFEFSNRIGAYVTYILMWAMSPENNDISKFEHKDELVKKLVKNAVLRIIPAVILQFKDSVFKGISQYPTDFDAKVRYMNESPSYLLSKETVDQVKKAILHLYPRIYYELQLMTENLSKELTAKKRFEEELEYERQIRKRCLHKWGPPKMIKKGSYYKKCVSCGFPQQINKFQLQQDQKDRNKDDKRVKYSSSVQ